MVRNGTLVFYSPLPPHCSVVQSSDILPLGGRAELSSTNLELPGELSSILPPTGKAGQAVEDAVSASEGARGWPGPDLKGVGSWGG